MRLENDVYNEEFTVYLFSLLRIHGLQKQAVLHDIMFPSTHVDDVA